MQRDSQVEKTRKTSTFSSNPGHERQSSPGKTWWRAQLHSTHWARQKPRAGLESIQAHGLRAAPRQGCRSWPRWRRRARLDPGWLESPGRDAAGPKSRAGTAAAQIAAGRRPRPAVALRERARPGHEPAAVAHGEWLRSRSASQCFKAGHLPQQWTRARSLAGLGFGV